MPEVDLLRAEVFRLAGMLDQQKLENARLRKVVEAARAGGYSLFTQLGQALREYDG